MAALIKKCNAKVDFEMKIFEVRRFFAHPLGVLLTFPIRLISKFTMRFSLLKSDTESSLSGAPSILSRPKLGT